MRIASLTYNEARDCTGSGYRDEKQISTYILSFEIAEQLLESYGGQWKITHNELVLNLQGLSYPLTIDFSSEIINYGSLMTRFYHRYSPVKGVRALVQELCTDLAIPFEGQKVKSEKSDFVFKVLVKLVEIFHARCDLQIKPGKTEGEWEISLSQGELFGWVGRNMIAVNRLGEKLDISEWENLRAEKAATYLFGFNRFCKNFECPMR